MEKRCARGRYVVDEENVRAAQQSSVSALECTGDIFYTLHTREFRLRARCSRSQERGRRDRCKVTVFKFGGQRQQYELDLVETALPLPSFVQRDRNEKNFFGRKESTRCDFLT